MLTCFDVCRSMLPSAEVNTRHSGPDGAATAEDAGVGNLRCSQARLAEGGLFWAPTAIGLPQRSALLGRVYKQCFNELPAVQVLLVEEPFQASAGDPNTTAQECETRPVMYDHFGPWHCYGAARCLLGTGFELSGKHPQQKQSAAREEQATDPNAV